MSHYNVDPDTFLKKMTLLGWERVPDGTHGHIVLRNPRTSRRIKFAAPGRKNYKDQTVDSLIKVVARDMGISKQDLIEKLRSK